MRALLTVAEYAMAVVAVFYIALFIALALGWRWFVRREAEKPWKDDALL